MILHCRNVTFIELFLLKVDIEVRQYAYKFFLSASFTSNAQTKMRHIVCPPNCSIKSVKPQRSHPIFHNLACISNSVLLIKRHCF